MIDYLASILMFALIYGLLALALNLQWGHTGLANLGHLAFFIFGAYCAALLMLMGWPFVAAAGVGAVGAGVLAYPLGWVALRLRTDYFAVVMLGLGEVANTIVLNEDWTGGSNGLPNVPRLLGFLPPTVTPYAQLAFTAGLFLIVLILLRHLTAAPYGRILRAIQANELTLGAVGKNAKLFKISALAIGSSIAGLTGAVYASYIRYISPDQFTSSLTFLIFAGVVLGGSSHLGAAAGTLLFVALIESSRFVGDMGIGLDAGQLANLRVALVGVALVVLMRFRPQGLFPYQPAERYRGSE